MGLKTKRAKGPNPLSIKKKLDRPDDKSKRIRKKRVRKGKRSKELSRLKKESREK